MEAEGTPGGTMEAELAMEFWTAVEDCLVRFHQFPSSTAREQTHGLRLRLREIPQAQAFRDLIYHEEPWYIAAGLAGKAEAMLAADEVPAYRALLRRHGLFPAEHAESSASISAGSD